MFHTFFFSRKRAAKSINASTSFILHLVFILNLFTIIEVFGEETRDCPYKWRVHNNRCFLSNASSTHPSRLTREDAILECNTAAPGGQLAKILNKDEEKYLRRMLQQTDTPAWLSAELKSTDNGQIRTWSDGTPMDYRNFDPNIPLGSDCDSDCCGVTVDKNGEWGFSSCVSLREFICEIDDEAPTLNDIGVVSTILPAPVVPVADIPTAAAPPQSPSNTRDPSSSVAAVPSISETSIASTTTSPPQPQPPKKVKIGRAMGESTNTTSPNGAPANVSPPFFGLFYILPQSLIILKSFT